MFATKSEIIMGLAKIRGIGSSKIIDLFEHFIKVANNMESVIVELNRVKNIDLMSVWQNVESDIKYAKSQNICITTIADSDFPVLSSNTVPKGDRPVILYYQGDISLLKRPEQNIAIIGTRTPDIVGISACEQIVASAVKAGFNTVSGLANGCDSVAHSETYKHGGKTIAVLPTPPNNTKINSDIANNILDAGGLLVSEYLYPDKSKSEYSRNCSKRDKLIVMFSQKLILISGSEQSGSAITVQNAIKYNVPVLAVAPDNNYSNTLFRLNNKIIKDGSAKPIDIKDNCISLSWLYSKNTAPSLF